MEEILREFILSAIPSFASGLYLGFWLCKKGLRAASSLDIRRLVIFVMIPATVGPVVYACVIYDSATSFELLYKVLGSHYANRFASTLTAFSIGLLNWTIDTLRRRFRI